MKPPGTDVVSPVRLGGEQFGDQRGEAVRVPLGTSDVDDKVAAFDPPQFAETMAKAVETSALATCAAHQGDPRWPAFGSLWRSLAATSRVIPG
jgi:hypothetical protein